MAAEKEPTAVDPFETFRKLRDSYFEGMSKVLVDAVNTEEYAQATGTLLKNYVTYSAPIREVMDKSMVMALEQFSLPSRQQVVALAERFTNLEMRLDDLDAKLDQLVALASATRISAPNKTAARKRPAAPHGRSHKAKARS